MKCTGTSGPSCLAIQRVMASISASESLTPGISRLVISSQTPVSCLRYRQGLQHRVQGGKAHPGGEVAGESLQVHVRRVDVSEELRPRLRAHVPGRHRHRLDARLPACIGHVDRVLQEDHRVVVGERDAAAPPGRAAARAMVGGIAWSASVSVSRDLEMSQFWQNRQPRLHPAVPKDSTAEPGRKRFSGFFSTGPRSSRWSGRRS